MLEKSESAVLKEVGSFFGRVERALFEVITWVVIVPRTLWWVLSSPREVPDYVRRELTDDQPDTFQDSISPVFLYLLAALGPFLLIQIVNPKLPIAPDDEGYFVDGASTFTVTKADGPYREDVVIRWDVVHDADTIRVHQCGRAAQADCRDQAMAFFEARARSGYAREPSDSVAGEVRNVVADRFGAETARSVYDFWCSDPPWVGCPGYRPSPRDLFRRITGDGRSADEALDSASLKFGDVAAAEVAAFWCSPPAYAGCEDSRPGRIWEELMSLGADRDPDAAWVSAQPEEDRRLAGAIFDLWNERYRLEDYAPAPPPQEVAAAGESGETLGGIEEAFEALIESGIGVDAVQRALAERYGAEAAAAEAAYWCAPPAFDGCDGSRVEQAWDEFRAFLDSGAPLESARARVAETDAMLAEALYDWCSPTGIGCMSEAPPAAADCMVSGAEVKADSVFTSITCAWNRTGAFSVSASVRRLANGELLDLSESLGGVVAPRGATDPSAADKPQSRADVSGAVKPAQDRLRDMLEAITSDRGGEDGEKADLTTRLSETKTMLVALAMLVLPLGMGLVVIPWGDGMTPGSIKPRFYIQCLYLTPVVLAIWIPFVLVNYVPEPELVGLSVYLAAALIVVLLGWLLLTEVDLLSSERGVSKLGAVLICLGALAVCLGVARVLLDHESAAASLGLTKFNIVAYMGIGLVVLLILPGLAGVIRLLRGRRTVEP